MEDRPEEEEEPHGSRGKILLAAAVVFACTMAILVSMGGNPMQSEFVEKLAIAIAPTALTLCGGWIAQIAKRMEAEDSKRMAERMALRALLRNELLAAHREWAEEKGYITVAAYDFVRQTYVAYHGIGGNGTGTDLFLDLKALPRYSTERKQS